MNNIYMAINAVMNEVGAVGKNHKNDQQKYQYRGIDDVMTALAPAMQKHGVFVVPEVLTIIREEKEGRSSKLLYSIVKVKYTFYAVDGTFVTATVMGEGMDSGDKATNKAMSAAFKYALLQTFCIPTDELVDSEKDSPEVVKKPMAKGDGFVPIPRAEGDLTISGEAMSRLITKCAEDKVHPQKLCALYGVQELKEMTSKQFAQICQEWTKVIKKECAA